MDLMGLLSYTRAGAAKRQARAALRAVSHQQAIAQDLYAQNEELARIVLEQARAIERLEEDVAALRAEE